MTGQRWRNGWAGLAVIAALASFWAGCAEHVPPQPGHVLDEARRAGRDVASLPAADEDYFHDMDGGPALSAEEIRGRDTWLVWTGGDDRLWDVLSAKSVGTLDFLKILSSHPSLKFSRDTRWNYLGLVNEPCFEKATGPDPERFGLWLDKRRADCPPDPFENEQKYPGVKVGARGTTVPAGSYYGYATGIVGLRLFPNPDFDEKAKKRWNADRYYTDRSYYESSDLVRPYRVGMSCAFCHVGPNPIKPSADPENPKWENLSSNVGAQYFWISRIFAWEADPTSFPYQVFHTARPGSLDTSLVSTDYINNPRTMNAVYALGPRLANAKRWGKETLANGSLDNRQFNDFVASGPLTEFFQKPDTVWSPRVLKDGSDSVGPLGALNRVYLNIGLFSEEWMLHFNALVGGKPTTPIEIKTARENSSYWQATELQTPDLARFFLATTAPHKLKDAPGGSQYLTADSSVLFRGKEVFAERCARCHSSKIPAPAPGLDPNGCSGAGYLECWNRYWAWTKTDEFKAKIRQIVLADDFLDGNFLSTELRVPVTLMETNACSPLATNALRGNIWDNFSSETYKQLPSVGKITVFDPYSGAPRSFTMPGGGRGFTRPASLISLWATAPYLLNNSVGPFDPDPSVDARMRVFEASMEQMLWPEKRAKDTLLGDKVPGLIDRTTTRSYLRVADGYLPKLLQPLRSPLHRDLPALFGENGIEIGPIPAGTPVGLLSNLELVSEDPDPVVRAEHDVKLLGLLVQIKHDLLALPANPTDEQARAVFANLLDELMGLSRCPDYVVNRGHYFGTHKPDSLREEGAPPNSEPELSDADKRALIEFAKTF
jgi:hypothetical protein